MAPNRLTVRQDGFTEPMAGHAGQHGFLPFASGSQPPFAKKMRAPSARSLQAIRGSLQA